ncbi:MAG: aminotransferase class I/II-fold pyridoxal phosphate-dependent enzyme, partial [Acidobacteriota bacterium]
PTPEMRQAMANAPVGDDVFQEDPTVRLLQETAAEMFEQEAALFVPSGTMGNQIAVKLHTRPGQEVVTEARGHIYNYELAMLAAFSGCLARPITANQGRVTWSQIEPVLSPPVYYRAPTGLIALENTHNMAGGTILDQGEVETILSEAHERGLPVHLDGARIFNAAIASGRSVAELTRGFDSVMFCLSKGLSAPVGSLLLGSQAFIEAAWPVRKMLGGGLRQVGILAAAGLIALRDMPGRLVEDHDNARLLAEGLAELKAFSVEASTVQTNIVIADLVTMDSSTFLKSLAEKRVLAVPTGARQVRLVTHKDVNQAQVQEALQRIREVVS